MARKFDETKQQFGEIFAINPASHLFAKNDPTARLNARSAKRVKVMLTKNSVWLDQQQPVGGWIYVIEAVEGSVLYKYAVESVKIDKKYTSFSCATAADAKIGKYSPKNTSYMVSKPGNKETICT